MLTHASAQPEHAAQPLAVAVDDAATPAPPLARAARAGSARGVLRQFTRYARALLWVARDALPRFKGTVAIIIVCNILGLASTVGAVGGVMLYVRNAEHGQPMRILRWTFDLGGGMASLLVFGGVIAGLGILSAACTYLSDRLILSLARQYHTLNAGRALEIVADPLCRGWQIVDEAPPRAIIARMAGSASRSMALVLRDMLRIILPALTFVAALGFLIWIDGRLTLMLAPVGGVYLIVLYVINRRVMRKQREYRARSPEARSEIGRRLRSLLRHGEVDPETGPPRDALQQPAYRDALAALYGRLLADRRVHLLNSAFFIACLVALLVVFGMQARERGRPWSDLLAYFIALRYAITSLRQASALLAKFSRFFPEYHAYAAFVHVSETMRARRAQAIANLQPLPETLTIRLGRGARWDSPRGLRWRRGDLLWILTPAAHSPPDHVDLEAAALRLEARLSEASDITTSAAFFVRPDRLRQADEAPAPAIFLSGALISHPTAARALASWRKRANMVIVHDEPPVDSASLPASIQPELVLVTDGYRPIAGGDRAWAQQHASDITAFLLAQSESAKSRGAPDDIDDEEDDNVE